MLRMRTLIFMALMIVGLSSTVGLAQELLSISRKVIPGGGTVSAGSSYTLRGSIGQPITATSSDGAYRLSAGYWTSHSIARPDDLFIYLPVVDR